MLEFFVLTFLPLAIPYVVNCHGQTLLPQYLGMYRVTVNDQESYLLAMRNVFSPRVTIHKKYDLKVRLFSSILRTFLSNRPN
ncbi:unnamed protein product [Dibothriocephalus latus]|uniref:PIPK domain-containing protein n=1 Tax=Dibothriocephalus latus TaxID=60516 RepID=A0A3P7L7S8_DIBLA|nr:unnamed protein product [Dibothriocephalus latus]